MMLMIKNIYCMKQFIYFFNQYIRFPIKLSTITQLIAQKRQLLDKSSKTNKPPLKKTLTSLAAKSSHSTLVHEVSGNTPNNQIISFTYQALS